SGRTPRWAASPGASGGSPPAAGPRPRSCPAGPACATCTRRGRRPAPRRTGTGIACANSSSRPGATHLVALPDQFVLLNLGRAVGVGGVGGGDPEDAGAGHLAAVPADQDFLPGLQRQP